MNTPISILFILSLALLACNKDNCDQPDQSPDPDMLCDTILTTDMYHKGHQGDGWFEGVYNCYDLEGSAQATFYMDADSNQLMAVGLTIFRKFGGPKISLRASNISFIEDSSLEPTATINNIKALTIFDHIEEVEDLYHLDTSADNSIAITFMSRKDTNLVTGKLTAHLKVDEPKVTSSNPDEMYFIDCIFECRFWN